ncbi:MAG: sulfite exporter TauE/SafE family protein [Streptosporangiaceae bacterium]
MLPPAIPTGIVSYRGPMLGPGWTQLVALVAAFGIAVLATPAGISGAVLLLPFQVSVLGTPSPAVTPTNLLYNVVATPGALYRYWRQGQTGGRLALVLIAGTLPGVIAGSVIRVTLLPSPHLFDFVVAAVLLPLGAWLAPTRPVRAGGEARPVRVIPLPVLILLAVVVGCVGGIYGIGGGSILAPILIGTGRPPREVAPAALASTFVTSVAGVVTFLILSAHHHGSVAPDWPTGIALGIGGLAGAYTGARLQRRLPDVLIRRVMGVLVVAIGVRYLWSGLG